MDVASVKKVHMVGVKGAGMTALAQLMVRRGVAVTGSDVADRFFTDDVLESIGVNASQFDASNIVDDLDAVIYSTAYNSNNVEIAQAVSRGVPIITYPEALAQLFNNSNGIAIAGSHGKTTTSAMLAFVIREIGLDPTAIIGSKVIDFDGSAIVGGGDYFVIEADEYQNKLAYYHPHLTMITSIDYDHPDFFPDRSSYMKVFVDFASRVIVSDGRVVVCIDDEGVRSMIDEIGDEGVISYGWSDEARYMIDSYRIEDGLVYFNVMCDGLLLGEFSTQLVGRHNVSNACGVVALLHAVGVNDWVAVSSAMSRFRGTSRRFERKGFFGDIAIIDDYAHHPTEVAVTLGAAREMYPDSRIWCVFAPHTFSRTEALMDDFSRAFSSVDRVLLLDIYASAREVQGSVSSRELCNMINGNGASCEYVGTLERAADYVVEHKNDLDILITMGAGDAWRVGDILMKVE